MKPYVFVIGDVHGELGMFQELLQYYNRNLHQLILIGDLNDRGAKSKECLLLAQKLVKEEKAIYLKGNHEEMLLNFIKEPEELFSLYVQNGGVETIESLLHPGATEEYSPTEMGMMLRFHHKELITMLETLPYYYEWGKYIFVHAGVNLELKDWKKSTVHDFLWIREPFHLTLNNTGKTIVFGHTITPALHGDNQETALWQTDEKIGIDGGGVYGGSLHGVIFDPQNLIQDIEIQNRHGPWSPRF